MTHALNHNPDVTRPEDWDRMLDELEIKLAEISGGGESMRQWLRDSRRPSPVKLMYHAFEQGMYAGIQGANHKRDCLYATNDYRMWWMQGCIVGEQRRQARIRIAELEAASPSAPAAPTEQPAAQPVNRVTIGVRDMLEILEDQKSTEDEKWEAASTICELVAPDIMEKAYGDEMRAWEKSQVEELPWHIGEDQQHATPQPDPTVDAGKERPEEPGYYWCDPKGFLCDPYMLHWDGEKLCFLSDIGASDESVDVDRFTNFRGPLVVLLSSQPGPAPSRPLDGDEREAAYPFAGKDNMTREECCELSLCRICGFTVNGQAAEIGDNECAHNGCLDAERLQQQLAEAQRERDEARLRLLSAAGDDLCRLSQDEIKELSSGAVKIPPKEEFLASCERFHQQIADGPGVLTNCLTLAQLIAENERVQRENAELREKLAAAEWKVIRGQHGQTLPAGWWAVAWNGGPPHRYTNIAHSEGGLEQVGGFTYIELPNPRSFTPASEGGK